MYNPGRSQSKGHGGVADSSDDVVMRTFADKQSRSHKRGSSRLARSGEQAPWDKPEGKVIATLTKDTPLARTANVDPKGRIWWGSVVVIGGPNGGKRGWVRGADLA